MNNDNWDLNADESQLKIELYNNMIQQRENEIRDLEYRIEKLILCQMEINQGI
jgi:hypothetical protein